MEKVRIYLDDVRTPIEEDWVVCRNYEEFVNKINEIGLDKIYSKKFNKIDIAFCFRASM